MITIYNLNSSRSERIIWLMEELGLPYELVQFSRTAQGAAVHSYQNPVTADVLRDACSRTPQMREQSRL